MTKVTGEDARRAIARLRGAMGDGEWSWDDVESYLAGCLSLDYDVESVLDFLRGDPAPSTGELAAAARLRTRLGGGRPSR